MAVMREFFLVTLLQSSFASALKSLDIHASVTDPTTAPASFRIIVLPDTQNYVEDHGQYHDNFNAQTSWIADQVQLHPAGTDNAIEFVTHVGDIVNRGGEIPQHDLANASMSTLGSEAGGWVVPYSVTIGNHDFDRYYHSTKAGNTAHNYREYWGPRRFGAAGFFGGADNSGLNTYQYFSAAGMTILHLALEWQPTVNLPVRDPSPVTWAKQVLADHAGMPTILSTHEYLMDNPGGRSQEGDRIWEALVRDNDQIFMVLCGHFHDVDSDTGFPGGHWYQVSKNNDDNDVLEVLQDFQDYPGGGGGWLRSITFHSQQGNIHFETFNAATGEYNRSSADDIGQRASDFFLDLDLAQRFGEQESS